MVVDVIVVGQTPPPIHGQAVAIERLVRGRFDRIRVHHVRMTFSEDVRDVGRFQLRKLWRLARLIRQVLSTRAATGARVLYYPPAGPRLVPILRDMVFLLAVRRYFPVLILDYHAAGLESMEPRLPAPFRRAFRRAYHHASLAIRKYPPDASAPVLPARHDVVIPYGIDDVFPSVNPVRREANSFTILFVGILTPGKGIWTVLDALALLREQGTEVQAVFVGEFDSVVTESQWNEHVARAELIPYVRVTGPLVGEAKWKEFQRADAFCFPTHYENEALPLVLIEAMQFGLPVVATSWRGIPTLVQDGVTGFIVPPRDAAGVADRLGRLQADFRLRAAMGAAGRRAYEKRFTIDAYLSAMEQAIATVSAQTLLDTSNS